MSEIKERLRAVMEMSPAGGMRTRFFRLADDTLAEIERLEAEVAQLDASETRLIAERDEAEAAVQKLDAQTGGDGEYYFSTDDPDAPSTPAKMCAGIAERYSLLKAQVARILHAFELGFVWRGHLQGQTLEDSRAVARTLCSDLFDGLTIDWSDIPGFATADIGIVHSKRAIREALVRDLVAKPEAEAVCGTCGGRGWVGAATGSQFANIGKLAREGRLPKRPCADCNGTGKEPAR